MRLKIRVFRFFDSLLRSHHYCQVELKSYSRCCHIKYGSIIIYWNKKAGIFRPLLLRFLYSRHFYCTFTPIPLSSDLFSMPLITRSIALLSFGLPAAFNSFRKLITLFTVLRETVVLLSVMRDWAMLMLLLTSSFILCASAGFCMTMEVISAAL